MILSRVLKNPEIKLAAMLVGGVEPARTITLQLLESGKDIVTANKLLLAEHGPELFDRARELGRSIAFDASVAGGIPIITNIGQCFSANQIQSLRGILNGTTNFIVSQMEEQGADYAVGPEGGAAAGLCRAGPDDGRQRRRCGAEAGDSGPSGVRGARALERDSLHRHRHARRGRHAVCQGAGLSDQADRGGAAARKRPRNCTSRRRW